MQYGAAPAAVAVVPQHFGAGVVWTGPWAARPQDELGIACSDSWPAAHAGFTHGVERETEAYYALDASHGWTVQPDFESRRPPVGGDTPDTVPGLIRVMFPF